MTNETHVESGGAGTYRETLRHRGLQPFLWTQFLGAFNDNVFKIAVSLMAVGIGAAASGGGEQQLSLVGAIFVAPFLLFSGYAGQLADIYSKRTVLIVTKSIEIVAMVLGLVAFSLGHLELTFGVLFLMATHSTFFSPAKYGLLPEVMPERDLSRVNGLLEMSTFVAIVAGTAIGSYMFDIWKHSLWLIGAFALAIAVVGTACSFGIPRSTPAIPNGRFEWNPWQEIWLGLKRLYPDRVLWPTVVGQSYFWFLGALLQLVMVLFGKDVLGLTDTWVGILLTFAAIGIGLGSMAAGRLSGDKIELGLAPIGAIGMGVFSLLLAGSGHSFALAAISLTLIGFSGGLFAVPLNALLQHRAGADEKGRLLATNNFLNMIGIAAASGALSVMSAIGWGPERIILVFGVLTLLSSVYILARVPEFMIRFSLWLLTHTIYRIRIVGQEHVPSRGPALLVCNHLSHVDGALVGACVQRFIRFMVFKPYYEHWTLHWLLKLMKAIPISTGRDAPAALARAREELVKGHVVCIFAEGSISRTGNLLPFKRGFERIVSGLDVPVVPVYLDRVWGSIFSYKGGRFLWKRPARIPYPVTVAFGQPLPSSTTAAEARLAMMTLGAQVMGERRHTNEALGPQFVRTAKHQWRQFCMADSTGASLSYGRTLVGALLLARWIRRNASGSNLGLLLPSSVGGAIANIAASFAGKVVVNLNFTAGAEAMSIAIERCGIRTILTSRAFITKAGIAADDRMVFLEDVIKTFSGLAKAQTLVVALLMPGRAINRFLIARPDANALATVVFSSGSTGIPKGVMLTHRSILANVDAVQQVFDVKQSDVMLGVLPFFHSFGFTGTLWFPIISGFSVVYHPNPTDAKTIGELAEKYRATMLISTPTFCSAYVRKCKPEQFANLRYAMVGAEKLREPVAAAFKEKFGLALLEGYGCTEMAPIVAVNRPDVTSEAGLQRGTRVGTVGHPLPGVAAKIVDANTGEGPIFDREGLLLVSGPNRMVGYLGEDAKTRDVVRDGWYVTGDIAAIDEDGFIRITDRLSRFSKIGGEMVPHMKVEDQINDILAEPHQSVVTSVPDDVRGERLVVLFTDPDLPPHALWERLCQSELPRLWLPKREDLHFVEAIPTLGTGKVDLKAVRQIAMERV